MTYPPNENELAIAPHAVRVFGVSSPTQLIW